MAFRTALERRHRKSARIALYFSLVASSLVAVVLVETIGSAVRRAEVLDAESQEWAYTDWEEDPAVKVLQGYLRVDTNWQTGSELAGAQYLAGLLEEAGIEPHLERLGEDKANLWAILEGEERGAVVLHHHIDVEPIHEPEKWDYPPFAGHIRPPWIYGRGVFDMKSLAVAQLMAMLELKQKGVRPRKSLIFLATGSEEVGSDLGSRWILRNHPELVERFEVLLTEGGVVEAIDRDEIKYWGVSFGQKQYARLIACSSSKQRLADLNRDVRGLDGWNPQPLALPTEVEIMMGAYSATRTADDLRSSLENPQALLTDFNAFLELPGYLKAMLRNEAYVGRILPTESGYETTVYIHVLPGQDVEAARRDLVPDWMLQGTDWVLRQEASADRGSSTEHPAFRKLVEGIRQWHPEATVGPYFLPRTATDARFYRKVGVASYGVSPFLIFTPDTMTGNSPNERIALPGFVEGVKLYSNLVERLVE